MQISCSSFKETLTIIYEDDGVGFNFKQKSNKGIGLKNIEERILSINGDMLFDVKENRGVSVSINIPI